MSMSNYLEGKLLDYVLRGTAYTAPTGRYLALFTSDPTEVGSGSEVNGASYTRQAITFNASANGTASNSSDITFPMTTEAWGNVSHVAVYDALTLGNLLFYGALTTVQQMDINNQLVFKAGQITITLD